MAESAKMLQERKYCYNKLTYSYILCYIAYFILQG